MKKEKIDRAAKELSELLPLLQQKLIKPFEQLAKTKISPMQLYVLLLLDEKAEMAMTQISNELLTSKQQMTPIIDKLIEYGFVARRNIKEDRRVVKIFLSSKGKRFLEEQKKQIFDMLKNKIRGLNNDDLDSLYKAFFKIREIINKLI
jgi:DNA-binding MarR family transcriptional regulator